MRSGRSRGAGRGSQKRKPWARRQPISIAAPWGINVGDFLGHVPLPAKITVEALPPIRLRDEFGPEPDVDEAYEHVVRLMQETLDALAAERRFPVLG